MNNNFYNYIILLAFDTANKYQGKESIEIKDLFNFRLEISKIVDDKYNKNYFLDDNLKDKLNNFLKSQFDMKSNEELLYLLLFLRKYNDFFSSDGKSLYLNGTLQDLQYLKDNIFTNRDEKVICSFLDQIADSKNLIEILKADSIIKDIEKLHRIENVIEEGYLDYENENSKNAIRIGNLAILNNFKRIVNLPEEDIRRYSKMIFEKSVDEYMDGSFFLISSDIENKSRLFEENAHITDELGNIFQQAIFDDNSLTTEQLNNYFDNYWEIKMNTDEINYDDLDLEYDNYYDEDIDEDEYDEDDDFDYNKTNLIFYISYIDRINYYLKNFNKDEVLLNSKKRLLYALNPRGYNLYEEKNYNKLSKEIKSSDINIDTDFNDFYVMSMLFLTDILNGWLEEKDTLLRKILFISTYYDITNDSRILNFIKKYINEPIGLKVYNAIINHSYLDFRSENKKVKKKQM